MSVKLAETVCVHLSGDDYWHAADVDDRTRCGIAGPMFERIDQLASVDGGHAWPRCWRCFPDVNGPSRFTV